MGFNSGFKGLNKKYIYSYLKCIVYDKLLKPRQSFVMTLYTHKHTSYVGDTREVIIWLNGSETKYFNVYPIPSRS